MTARYRSLREVGFSRREAFVLSLVPTRIRVAYAAVRGRPVAYRLNIENGAIHFDSRTRGAIVAECRISMSPLGATESDPDILRSRATDAFMRLFPASECGPSYQGDKLYQRLGAALGLFSDSTEADSQ